MRGKIKKIAKGERKKERKEMTRIRIKSSPPFPNVIKSEHEAYVEMNANEREKWGRELAKNVKGES